MHGLGANHFPIKYQNCKSMHGFILSTHRLSKHGVFFSIEIIIQGMMVRMNVRMSEQMIGQDSAKKVTAWSRVSSSVSVSTRVAKGGRAQT